MSKTYDLGLGFCLGNTFDAWECKEPISHDLDWETAWHHEGKVTEELILRLKEKGFKTIRVPVTWIDHFKFNEETNEYEMEDWWIKRIEEVVHYIIDNKMYCIIDVHHDVDFFNSSILYNDGANFEKAEERFYALWKYLAEYFKDCSDYLVYEDMNELGLNSANQKYIDLFNRLNANFVKIIREVEGNSDRLLLLEGFAGRILETYEFFEPVDDDNYQISIHFYYPWNFTIADPDSKLYSQDLDITDIKAHLMMLDEIEKKFGHKVCIGEFGCRMDERDPEIVAKWFKLLFDHCKSSDISLMLWDIYFPDQPVYRKTLESTVPNFYEMLEDFNNREG